MRLKLTLSRPSGSSSDIVVTTDAGATINEVAQTINRVDPLATPLEHTDLTLRATIPGLAEPMLLPADAPVGEAWIGSGATVTLTRAGHHFEAAESRRGPAVATLQILDGPDAGRTVPLASGSWTLGRDADCDIVLDDKLVSKRHLRLEVGDAVGVVDLGSANGVVVDGGIVTRLRVEREETLLLGDTRVLITVLQHVSAAAATKAGPVFFNRSPKVEQRYRGREFAAPDVPTEPEEQPFPYLALIAPVLLGLSMFALTGRVFSLLFVFMAPLMLLGNHLTQKQRDKRKQKRMIERFESRIESLEALMSKEAVVEQSARLAESPSTYDAYEAAVHRSPLLWTRRPEHWSFLNVRLGIGTMLSRNTIGSHDNPEMLPEFQERLDALVERTKRVPGVPIIDNLYDAGALGVAGDPDTAIGSVNSILVQLTALHSPAELAVATIVTPRWSEPLSWLKWMPHTSSPHSPLGSTSHLADSASSGAAVLSAIEELIAQRLAGRKVERRGAMEQRRAALDRGNEVGQSSSQASEGTKSPVPAVVVLISNDADLDRARLVQLAESAADAGVYPIWLGTEVHELPAVCRTYLHIEPEQQHATVGLVRLGETITDVVTEVVSPDQALDFARRMAPVIDAGALVEDSSDLPRSISLVTLLGHELIETSDAVIDRWRQNESIHDRTPGSALKPRRAGKLRATVGSAGVDAMHLDLRTQGPHALVGGTTGAGKSEFLQAWVLGMAAEYSPDRVTFLFVDYKGGSAFADCVSLPHCVGLVTDLSPHLVRRALTSLRAELHHREHLLNRKKAKDLLELEKRGDPESPPALVLVIDEFAALVGEVPEFVDGVVDIAQRGRSLGIHLIMATQRPAGVIRDNLRANTNLRVALRMADESDSQDVVGVEDAAHFDPGLPGRGVAKTGPGRLALFQSAYAGGWTSREPERAGIEVAELRFGSEQRWVEPESGVVEELRDLGPTDQQRLVTSIVAAAGAAGIPAPRRPWLDELAPVYDLVKLKQRTDAQLVLGVADMPQVQDQRVLYFEPDADGHLAFYGTGGSGKSAALRTLTAASGITPRGGPVQVYGLDFAAGSLRMLEELPNVGSIVSGDDSERIVRLFRMLKLELDRRGPLFAEANAGSIAEYRRLAGRPDEPRILLLVDGFPSFRDDWEIGAGRSASFDVFKDILSDGRRLGMHVLLTADRASGVPSSIASSIPRKVVLRLADESAYAQLDVPGDVLSSKSAPGRAIIDGFETQLAVLGGSTSIAEQSAALQRLAESMRRAGVADAAPIGSLPKEYALAELPAHVDGMPVLGINDELEPATLDPEGVLLVAGGPASGRTTALQSLAAALRRHDEQTRLYYFGNPRSVVGDGDHWTGTATSVDEVAALAKALAEAMADADTDGRIVVVVEALNEFLQSAADQPLVELIKTAKRSEHLLIAEAETSAWSSSWPLMGEVKNARRGLLLQPESIEGEVLLKTALPRIARSEFPPGRGMFIAKGKASRVQLPLPE
ncbi:FtsK/SpoIIIE domain-containing protein [Ruicaihuangia caeni]|uniref:FtsK/SpoIIIE domain-containing protein n=1 Tax=Ruicaihuangia caeni TaxID=3042517 RepID=UPI00338E4D05